MTPATPLAPSVADLLAQYAAYHRDQRNIVTHFVGIPLIVLGLAIVLARWRFSAFAISSSAAWAVWTLCGAWYLSRRGAPLLSWVVTLAVAMAVALAHPVARGEAWLAWGLGLFALGWAVQFLGHYYEGKKPAFMDDLIGLLVGPMFVTAEALFALGWNKTLDAEITRRAGPRHLRDLAHPA